MPRSDVFAVALAAGGVAVSFLFSSHWGWVFAGIAVVALIVYFAMPKDDKRSKHGNGDGTHSVHQTAHGSRSHNVAATQGSTVNFTLNEGPQHGWGGAGTPTITQGPPLFNPASDPVVVLAYGVGQFYRPTFTVANASDYEAREVRLEDCKLEKWMLTSGPVDRLPKNSQPVPLQIGLRDADGIEEGTINDVLQAVQVEPVLLTLTWKDPSWNLYRCEVAVSTVPLRLIGRPGFKHGAITKTRPPS